MPTTSLSSFRPRAACILAAAALALAAACCAPASAGILDTYNLVVFGNLTSSSEVEGRAAVGGNLGGPASNYGTMLTPAANFVSTDVLHVGGNITAGNVNMSAGRLRLGGSVQGGSNVNLNGGSTLVNDGGTAAFVAGMAATLQANSLQLAALSSNSTWTGPGVQPAPVTFNAAPVGGVAVFNIAGSLLSNGLVQSWQMNANGATTIIINVSGTSINVNAGNTVGAWATDALRARILWNFYEATSITVARQLDGAVLAPLAHLTNSTVIAGSVAVASFTQNGEVHLPLYTGLIPAPGAAGLLGLAGLAAARRRR